MSCKSILKDIPLGLNSNLSLEKKSVLYRYLNKIPACTVMKNQIGFATLSVFKNQTYNSFEIKNALFLNRSFPTHFHTHWSIALIKTGSENLYMDNQKLLIHANTLVLIPPYLPHRHDGQMDAFWAYEAVYFEDEGFKKQLPKGIYDKKMVLNQQPILIHLFQQFCNQLKNNLFQVANFEQFIHRILSSNDSVFIPTEVPHHAFHLMESVQVELTNHLMEKITLDGLCKKFKMEKFNLMRQFKKATGLTPNDYLMALRVETAKQLMYQPNSLLDIAFSTGFYDPSHFYHCFKKYVGLSPTEYRQNLQYFTSPQSHQNLFL